MKIQCILKAKKYSVNCTHEKGCSILLFECALLSLKNVVYDVAVVFVKLMRGGIDFNLTYHEYNRLLSLRKIRNHLSINKR